MVCNPWAVFEAYFEAKALHPKTNKFVGVRSLKVYRGLPRNAGLPFLVRNKIDYFLTEMFYINVASDISRHVIQVDVFIVTAGTTSKHFQSSTGKDPSDDP